MLFVNYSVTGYNIFIENKINKISEIKWQVLTTL